MPTKSVSSIGRRTTESVSLSPMLPPCRICSEKASGFHYGVNTCEACKAFFRRSLKKFDKYRCAENDACEILPGKRNSCAFCRFNKCIKLGMCKDAIKTGRYTHEKKAKDIKEVKGLVFEENKRNAVALSPSSGIGSESAKMEDSDVHSWKEFSSESSLNSPVRMSDAMLSPIRVSDTMLSPLRTSYTVLSPIQMSDAVLSPIRPVEAVVPWSHLHDKDQIERYEEIINHITDVHKSVTPYTEEFYEKLPEKESEYIEQLALKKEVFGELKSMSSDEYLFFYQATGIDVDGRREMIETLFLPHVEQCIKRFISFVKAIPGFCELCVEDQIALIKSSRFDSWMILCHRCFNPDLNLYVTLGGRLLHKDEMLKLNDCEFLDSMFALQRRIKNLGLTIEETCVLSAFAVMFTDHCPLRNNEIVERSQEQLLHCLSYLFQKHHSHDRMRFSRVISCIIQMRSTRELHHKAEERFSSIWGGIVNFPPLLYEMWSS